MNKKGFIYSFVVLLFIVLFISSFFFSSKVSLREKAYTESLVIKNLDNKLNYVQSDISRGIYIVGLRTLLAMNDIISETGNYIDNLDIVFNEIFFNGTYLNENIDIMNNTNFYEFKENLQEALKNDKIDINITSNEIYLSMSSPWHVNVLLNLTIYFSDLINTASWENVFLISSDISIYELNDPIYVVSTNGFFINQIRRSNITDFVIGNNVDNLIYHMENLLYVHSPRAPNYLMRLEGNFSSHEMGIESLINYDKFVFQGLPYRERSAVDFIYFSNHLINNQSNILGMPAWFLLDEESSNIYGTNNLFIE